MENNLIDYNQILKDINSIISTGLNAAYSATNRAIVLTYWHIGKRIIIQEQNGKERAEYGKALLDTLADELTREYGKCYSKRNLQYYRKFYLYFSDEEIVNAAFTI